MFVKFDILADGFEEKKLSLFVEILKGKKWGFESFD